MIDESIAQRLKSSRDPSGIEQGFELETNGES
jgi:hypothetical protein